MSEEATTSNQPVEERASGVTPLTMCPMAAMCDGMTRAPASRILLALPGALLILVGTAILLEPQVLVWLVAAVTILMGGAALMMAYFISRVGARSGAGG